MSWVKARSGESFESLMNRFKKVVEKSGILADLKKHEFYEKPSIRQKRKQAAARKRALTKQKKLVRHADKAVKNINFKWNRDHTKKIPLPPPRKFIPKKNFTKGVTKSGLNKNYKNSASNISKFTKSQSRPFNKGTKS